MSSVAEDSADISGSTGIDLPPLDPSPSQDTTPAEFLQLLLADQLHHWKSGQPLSAEHFLQQIITPDTHLNWTLELAVGEYLASRVAQTPVPLADLIRRFPTLSAEFADRLSGRTGTDQFTCRTLRSEDTLGTVWSGTDLLNAADVVIRYVSPSAADDVAQLLQTCRMLQKNPHPGIVPIHDYLQLPDGSVRIVTAAPQFVTLTEQINTRRPSLRDAASLLMHLARIVQHLHDHNLVHLALQPDSILVEPDASIPSLNCLPLPQCPDYFSPEQAADEDHRLDSRSDLFSLGTVFFQLLTGTKPFHSRTVAELKQQIMAAQPPRASSLQPAIPPTLDAICCGTLQRNKSSRNLTAGMIAQILQQWLQDTSAPSATTPEPPPPAPLRPFDRSFAETYPELLPGPRTAQQLPASIAHWKSLIEQQHANQTFQVALLSGPPGSGKTSFLSAGLLPRLSTRIVTVQIDAAHGDTEQRLFEALQAALPDLPNAPKKNTPDALPALFRAVRRQGCTQVLIVLDHFEHWLQENHVLATAPLTIALRQCRGGLLQALLAVSSDTLTAATRLMAELDIQLAQQVNHTSLDLLSVEAAAQLLIHFGRSAGRLQSNHQLTALQQQFINQAIAIIQWQGCVPQWQLALLMHISRDIPWQPAALQFLTETVQPLDCLLNRTVAQLSNNTGKADLKLLAVRLLKALLPHPNEPEVRISLTQEKLVRIAGPDFSPQEVENLLLQLSETLPLIRSFPTITTAVETTDKAASDPAVSWQLSHQLLITPLRHWLLNRLSQTPVGRTELLLENSTERWQKDPRTRNLPDFQSWLKILRYSDQRRWTPTQQLMLRSTEKTHIRRLTLLIGLLICVLVTGSQLLRRHRTTALARSITTTEIAQLPALLMLADRTGSDLDQYLRPHLADKARLKANPQLATPSLAAQMALLPRDPTQAEALATTFLSAELPTLSVLRNRLLIAADLAQPIWRDALLKPGRYDHIRFRAALGLAGMHQTDKNSIWSPEILQFVAQQLTSAFAERQPELRKLLTPIAPLLLPHLQDIFSSPTATTLQQTSAAAAIAEFDADNSERLARLLLIASPAQAELLAPPFARSKHQPSVRILCQPNEGQPTPTNHNARQQLALRHARAALTLAAADLHTEAVGTLRNASDPDTLAWFAILSKQWPVTAGDLVICLEINERNRIRPDTIPLVPAETQATHALLLALSQWPFHQIPAVVRDSLPVHLKRLYSDDPSALIHSLSGWLLRTWGLHQITHSIDEIASPYDPRSNRQWFRIHVPLKGKNHQPAGNTDNSHITLTFIVVPPGDYFIGNPLRKVTTVAPFAVCDRELTQSAWQLFLQNSASSDTKTLQYTPTVDDPAASNLSWVQATHFCRWLTRKFRGNDEAWQCFPPTAADSATASAAIQLHKLGFRMPTSDEWEIATRGSHHLNATEITDPQILHFYNWIAPLATAPHPPAHKPPEPNGLFDCYANLSEWTTDASQPEFRIHRGSSWDTASQEPLSNSTFSSPEQKPVTNVGIRLALTLPEPRRK